MKHTGWGLLLVASLVLGACGSGHPASTPTTDPATTAPATTTAPPPTTVARTTTTSSTTTSTTTTTSSTTTSTTSTTVAPTTTVPNPDVVPAVITPAYVNSVFVVLNHIWGNSLRAEVASGKVTPAVLADLRAVFNDPLYSQEVEGANQALSQLANVRNPPGDPAETVIQLISASPSCIFVKSKSNVAAVVKTLPPQGYDYYELVPKQSNADPRRLNTTPWALAYDLFFTGAGPEQENNPCHTA